MAAIFKGGLDHYSVGRYQLDDGKLVCEATIFCQGRSRTLFGKTTTSYALRFEGEVMDSGISGSAKDETGEFLVQFRADRLADLP